MKTQAQDWIRYNDLRRKCTAMIRAGQKDYQIFWDMWEELEAIKSKHNGMPPIPDDPNALDQEICEMAVENGLR